MTALRTVRPSSFSRFIEVLQALRCRRVHGSDRIVPDRVAILVEHAGRDIAPEPTGIVPRDLRVDLFGPPRDETVVP